MSGFNDFIQLELPKRPFTQGDGQAGDILVRSGNALAARELVWARPDAVGNPGLTLLAGPGGVSGHRAIRILPDGRAAHADPADADSYVGISLHAALEGEGVQVRYRDAVTEPSWAWVPGPIFFGLGGMLTQTPPTHGAVLMIGTATSATTILLARETTTFFV